MDDEDYSIRKHSFLKSSQSPQSCQISVQRVAKPCKIHVKDYFPRKLTGRKPLSLYADNRFMKKILGSSIILSLLLLFSIIVGSGCANIIPPSGGPRDSLPPVLVNALPRDSMLHFNGKKIVLTFNEYVQLDNNMNDNLIISPNPVNIPTIESKLRTVIVLLRDSLKPNTTYSINFGKGIKDVNEGNIAKNLTYVFSTGDKLDDGTLSGNVVLADNGKVDSTVLVVLHNNLNDTSIKKNSPAYYTRVDGKGNFVFHYIAPGAYNVFVLPNEYSKKYDDSTKIFAFLKEPLKIDSSGQSITLYAYREVKPTEKKSTSTTTNNKKKPPKENPPLKISTSATSGPQDLLSPFVFTLSAKIAKFDSSKIVLTDTNFVPRKGFSFSADTTAVNFKMNYKWEENAFYKILVEKEAFTDSLGTMLAKNDTIKIKTKKEDEYGSIRLHFTNVDLKKNPVILLIQQDKITDAIPLVTNEWYQKLFKPGDYELRILYDDNKNGVWDPGNYDKKTPPEIVNLIPRKLAIKANIDNEADIVL